MSRKQLWCLVLIAVVNTLAAASGTTADVVQLHFDGTLRDAVGQSTAASLPDGRPDGTFTMTLSPGSGTRWVTGLELRDASGGVWDTVTDTEYWTLGVASDRESPLYQRGGDRVSFVLSEGGHVTLFAADVTGGAFHPGAVFTLTVTFGDGTSAVATTGGNVPAATVALEYRGKVRDAVGHDTAAAAPDGELDGTFTLTLDPGSGARTIARLELRNDVGGVWDADTTTRWWLLGVARTPEGTLLSTGGPGFELAPGSSVTLFAADANRTMFVEGSVFTLSVTFADGTTARAVTRIAAAAAAPTITLAPAGASVTAPGSASFAVIAAGSAPLRYQWQRNGVDIEGATAAAYTTPATTPADSGSEFRVVVTNDTGSVTSTAAILTVNAPIDRAAPATPGNLVAVASSCTDVAMSWDASTDAGGSGLKGYQVYRDGALLAQVPAPATSAVDSGLSPATTYSYTVAAVDNAGNVSGESSAVRTATSACADTAAPSVPAGVAAAAASCSQITVTWTASTDTGSSGLAAYSVYRGGAFLRQVSAPATSIPDLGLTASTAYSYSVSAVDGAGNQSAQSALVVTSTPRCGDTTRPSIPSNLRVWAASCNRLGVMWSAASDDASGSGLKGYNVYRDGVLLKQIPTSSLFDIVPNRSSTYSYTVSAVDNAGNESAPSAPVRGSASALVSFRTPAIYPTGTGPNAVAIGDLNGDGVPDVVVANYGSNTVGVLLGRGDGTFQPQVSYATGGGPAAVAIGDLDGDGILDIVTANKNGHDVSVLLGRGDGTFAPLAAYPSGSAPMSVAIADLNGDGIPDLAVANYAGDNVSVLLGKGRGTFQSPTTYVTGRSSVSIAVGDLDGDGHPDIVTANRGSNDVSVLRGRGDGTFDAHVAYPTGAAPQSVTIGDLNGDGVPDLAVANFGGGTVRVLLGTGGDFQLLPAQTVYSLPGSVAIGHLNGDDTLDLVVTSQGGNVLTILTGDGTGAFQNTGAPITTGLTPVSVTIGDLDGDGASDVVVANFSNGTLSVLLSACR